MQHEGTIPTEGENRDIVIETETGRETETKRDIDKDKEKCDILLHAA